MLNKIFGTSSLFGSSTPKEKWDVQVIKEFTDLYVGMASDEHIRRIPANTMGVATVSPSGKITVLFPTIQDTPHTNPLKVYFKKTDATYNNYKWIKQIQ